MDRLWKFTGTCGLLFVMATPITAQSVVTIPSRSLTVTPASAQFSPAATTAPAVTPSISREATGEAVVIRSRGQGSTLMIVGGAAVLTGILIDEHVITVAGAIIGLYGLYLYVR